jgi:hypothetical protein
MLSPKIIAITTASVLALCIVIGLLLSSGGRLSGTYRGVDDTSVTLTFNGNELTVREVYPSGRVNTETLAYRIKGDRIILSESTSEAELSVPFQKKGSSIFIDGEEYRKQ